MLGFILKGKRKEVHPQSIFVKILQLISAECYTFKPLNSHMLISYFHYNMMFCVVFVFFPYFVGFGRKALNSIKFRAHKRCWRKAEEFGQSHIHIWLEPSLGQSHICIWLEPSLSSNHIHVQLEPSLSSSHIPIQLKPSCALNSKVGRTRFGKILNLLQLDFRLPRVHEIDQGCS